MSEPKAMCSKTHECRKAKRGVNRRHVIALLGVLNALSGVASAEPPKQFRRLGVLNTRSAAALVSGAAGPLTFIRGVMRVT